MPRPAALLCAVLCASPAPAAPGPARPPAEDVLVRAAPIPAGAFRRSSSSTVLGRGEIEALGARSLEDLVRRVAGAGVRANGPFGQAASVSLRGSEARHVLVLVDGVPMGDPTGVGGGAGLESIGLADVERVEVVRGPRGVLHGPAAMGGTVSVTTRRGGGRRRASLGLGAGSHDTRRARAEASGGAGRWDWAASAGALRRGGASVWPDWKDPGADRDGHGRTTARAGVGRGWGRGARLDASLGAERSDFEYDAPGGDAAGNRGRGSSRSWSLSVEGPLGGRLVPRAAHAGTRVERRFVEEGPSGPSARLYEGGTESWELGALVPHGGGGVAHLGVRAAREEARALGGPPGRFSGGGRSLWVRNYGERGRLFSDLGVRRETFRGRGGATTHRAGGGVSLGRATLRAGWGTGVKPPSLYQALGPFGGGPGLLPERTRGLDAGVDWSAGGADGGTGGGADGGATASLTLFGTRHERLLAFGDGRYENAGTFDARGLEVELRGARLPPPPLLGGAGGTEGATVLSARASLLSARDRRTGARPPLRRAWRWGLELDHVRGDALRAGLDVDMAGPARGGAGARLPSRLVVGLRGSLRAGRRHRHRLSARVGNLLDRRHEEVPGYAAPGRHMEINYTAEL